MMVTILTGLFILFVSCFVYVGWKIRLSRQSDAAEQLQPDDYDMAEPRTAAIAIADSVRSHPEKWVKVTQWGNYVYRYDAADVEFMPSLRDGKDPRFRVVVQGAHPFICNIAETEIIMAAVDECLRQPGVERAIALADDQVDALDKGGGFVQ